MGSTILRTSGGRLDPTDENDLTQLVARLAVGAPKVLLHLHGGLVDQNAAEKMAARLATPGGKESYNAPPDWEQIYIVWRTGARETLKQNWLDLAKDDRLYRAILKRLISFFGGKLSRSAGRSTESALSDGEIERCLTSGDGTPFAELDDARLATSEAEQADYEQDALAELRIELDQDLGLASIADDIEASLAQAHDLNARYAGSGDATRGRKELSHLDDDVRAEFNGKAVMSAPGRSGFVPGAVLASLIPHCLNIGRRVIRRYRQQRDHGLYATIVEELVRELYGNLVGEELWGMMKGDASEHFEAEGLGLKLLSAIAGNPKSKLVVVGHSAGSIFASALLISAERHKIPLQLDLVFLAPAVRMNLFADALDASEARIKKFRMFAMRDELERKDAVLGPEYRFVYPSSLLYLVSGLCEDREGEDLSDAPLLGMQRFLSPNTTWRNDPTEGKSIERVQSFLTKAPNRVVFSTVRGSAGLSSEATSHGSFDNDVQTLESVATFFG